MAGYTQDCDESRDYNAEDCRMARRQAERICEAVEGRPSGKIEAWDVIDNFERIVEILAANGFRIVVAGNE